MNRPLAAGDLVTVDGSPADLWKIDGVWRDGRVRLSRDNGQDFTVRRWARKHQLILAVPMEATDEEPPNKHTRYRRWSAAKVRLVGLRYVEARREAIRAANRAYYARNRKRICDRKVKLRAMAGPPAEDVLEEKRIADRAAYGGKKDHINAQKRERHRKKKTDGHQ